MSLLANLFDERIRAPAECVVRVDGRDIGPEGLYPLLREISVDTSRGEAWTASLTFDSRRDEQGRWDVQDKDLFEPWARVEIDARFGDRVEPVFHGYVRESQGEYPEERGNATFSVTCQDLSMALDREHRRHSWANEQQPATDSMVIRQILTEHGLILHPDSGSGTGNMTTLNQDETDIRFLRKRAEANGYELTFYVDSETAADQVYFGPMRLEATRQPTLRVQAGSATDVLQIRIGEDAQQPDRIDVTLADRQGDSTRTISVEPAIPVLGRSRLTSGTRGLRPYVVQQSGTAGDDEARIQAQAQMKIDSADIHRVVAEGELDGSLYGHVLQVGLPVGLDGVGDRHSGTYYVDRVTHVFDAGGYRQQFTLLRNAVGDNL